MSCTQNKSDAQDDFEGNSFASASGDIQVYNETLSTNNECNLYVLKGHFTCNLAFSGSVYPTLTRGTGKVYLKLTRQADSTGDDNDPPVTTHNPPEYEWDNDQTVTLNQTFTSTTYADQYNTTAPNFTTGNNCDGSDKIFGWSMTDAQVVMTRTILQSAYAKFS